MYRRSSGNRSARRLRGTDVSVLLFANCHNIKSRDVDCLPSEQFSNSIG